MLSSDDNYKELSRLTGDISDSTYKEYQALIYQEAGISLADSKKALLLNRITKRMRALGIETPESYITYVRKNSSTELEKLIDVVSTNLTYFYREQAHFDYFAEVVRRWKDTGKKSIRVWCAAASSGQEPYTIGMVLKENLGNSNPDVKILGTDICTDVLKKSFEGTYNTNEVSGVPPHLLKKYFELNNYSGDNYYTVIDELKSYYNFKKLNLSSIPFPLKGPIDVIFCRNVMIYFDINVRRKVINEFYRLLPVGGVLILSHSENLLGIEHSFNSLGNSIYRK